MKKFLLKIFNHAFFAIGTALGAGVLAMVGLVQLYDYFYGPEPKESVVENPVERALTQGQEQGPLQTLHIRQVPGPFLSPEDGRVIGFVFLDVAVDIAGEDAFRAAEGNLDSLVARFKEVLSQEGVGRSDLPGEVDYERLAKTFLSLARDEAELRGITRVRVSDAEGG